MSNAHSVQRRPIVARLIRVLSIPIIVFWVLVAVGLGVLAPSLDAVADKHSVSLAPQNSPAFQGMMNIGHVFKQFDSDSTAMVVLEGQDKLGDSAIASMILIFAIMLLITRSVVAALVIVSTVAASLGTACGLSVLLWQDILGLGLQWIVIPLSIVILLAVGSDYNLLVVSRLKEEIHAGLNTGIIRGMGATGRVVTAAGLVFAFTMMSMIVSDLRVVGQLGMTIGIGLLVDTLIVRSFMTPSIAAALGRWFWWPLNTFKIVKRRGPQPASDANTVPISQPAMV
jgi:uncharacterized membrane protein YdfJ with MMPL/SSD domain